MRTTQRTGEFSHRHRQLFARHSRIALPLHAAACGKASPVDLCSRGVPQHRVSGQELAVQIVVALDTSIRFQVACACTMASAAYTSRCAYAICLVLLFYSGIFRLFSSKSYSCSAICSHVSLADFQPGVYQDRTALIVP